MSWIVGRFTASWEHGRKANQPDDVGLPVAPVATPTGGVVCGIGTHYVSESAAELDKRLSNERSRVGNEIKRRFLASPIPGLYLIPDRETFERAIQEINPLPEINGRGVVYVLDTTEKNSAEIEDWIDKVRGQLTSAPLGRKDPGDLANGLKIVERLAMCPVLSEASRNEIMGLVAQARLEQIDRTEFKRKIAEVKLEMEVDPVAIPIIQPRRVAPIVMDQTKESDAA